LACRLSISAFILAFSSSIYLLQFIKTLND
jgi:hypothetical protein